MRRMLLLGVLFSTAFGAVVLAAADQPPIVGPAADATSSDRSAVAVSAAGRAPQAVPATAPASQPAATPVNKFCPIEPDNEIDPKGKTVTYKGQVIGFCCDSCIETFNKNPEKYAAKLK